MPRAISEQYAAQLEARARDIRTAAKRRTRATDTRIKVVLGALAVSYASAGSSGVRLLEAFARLPALKPRDAAFLAAHLPPNLAAPFAALSAEKDTPNDNA